MGGGASRKLLEEVQLRHGESTVQGRRQYNEDRSACHHPLVPAKKPLDYGQSFFGVFDGHGGEWCAEYIANHLHDCIARQSGYNAGSKTKEAAILKGFLYCDERCLVEQETNGEKSGTTACAAIIDHTDIYVSNCGDCLAFGTQVAKADGSHVSIESLRVGDQVLDKSGHPTSVTRAAHGASSKMVELAYALGVQSVTPNHLVTLRWSSDPTVALHRGTDRRCSLVVAAWWERDTLERHTQTWRFVQPADETPANGTRVPGAILPLDMSASQARDFAFAWLTESERAGRVHPLHRGDLFDVRASRLVKLFASDQFRPHVSMPMCPLVKALRSSPSSSASVGLGSASAVSAAQEIDKKSAAGVGVSLVGGSSSFSGVAASSSAMSVGHGEGKATCDATPDIVYMLADAEEAPSAASRAFARQQIEAAWEVIRLDATALKKNVRITDLHATQAADVVWAPTVTAALALEPRFLLAFGQRAHHCWLTDFRSLPIVQSGSVSWEVDEFAQEQEAPKPTLHLTLVSGAKVQVLFASHPSSRWQFDSVVHTIARAHGVPVPAVEFDLLTSRQFSLIESVEYGAGAEYVSMSVAAADERFLLSDGSVTHNSVSQAREDGRRQMGVTRVRQSRS